MLLPFIRYWQVLKFLFIIRSNASWLRHLIHFFIVSLQVLYYEIWMLLRVVANLWYSFVILNTFQHDWKMLMNSVCLYILPYSNSRKFIWITMKFLCLIKVYYRIFGIKNKDHSIYRSFIGALKRILLHYGLGGEKA